MGGDRSNIQDHASFPANHSRPAGEREYHNAHDVDVKRRRVLVSPSSAYLLLYSVACNPALLMRMSTPSNQIDHRADGRLNARFVGHIAREADCAEAFAL
jgi:hypothetical protein